jgi:hypothetical protein
MNNYNLILILLILILIILSLKFFSFEAFNPMNVFNVDNVVKVDPNTLLANAISGKSIPKFPINEEINVDTSSFIEQNKDTMDTDLKDALIHLTQQKIGNKSKLKVFKDSLEKIFMDKDSKNIFFNVNVYDIVNFFVYKIKVYISSDSKIDKNCTFTDDVSRQQGTFTEDAGRQQGTNCIVKISSDEENKIDSVKFVPIEEPSVPVYFRILNTLHLLDPFKTSSNLN